MLPYAFVCGASFAIPKGLAAGVRRYIVLGDKWAEAGQKQRAADCYRKVIAMSPDGPAAEEAKVRLERLGD